MDIKTLSITVTFATCIGSGVLALLFLQHRTIPGLMHWALGNGLISLGVFLVTMRGIPWQMGVLFLGNTCVIQGYIQILIGTRRFEDKPINAVSTALLGGIAMLPLLLWPDLAVQSDQRVIYVSLLTTICALSMAFSSWPAHTLAHGLFFGLFFIHGLFMGFRAFWTALHPTGIDYLSSMPLTIAMLAWGILIAVCGPPAYALMVSERLRNALIHQTREDPLTGLLNRRGFDLIVETLLKGQHRNPAPYALMMLDLDHFKRVNDNHGHEVGDRILTAAAQIMRRNLRIEDVVARFGGEEFIALLPNCDIAFARETAERLRQAIAMAPTNPPITISIGLAASASSNITHTELRRQADAALYQAKANGRNRVETAPSVASANQA